MKVVVDTMVWVSFSIAPQGFRRQLINAAIDRRVRLFTSKYILDELVHALCDYLEQPKRFAQSSRSAVARRTKVVELPPRIPRYVPADPKDDAVVQTAMSAKADYLVTADKEILKLKKVGNVAIITAAEFARLLGWSPE